MDTYKQLKQIIITVVESVLHLLKIHRKVVFGNSPVIVENMLGERPESLNAIDMIFGLLVDQVFRVINGEMFAKPFKRIIATKGIGVVDRAFLGFLPDDTHKLIGRDSFNHSGVNLAITLQEAKNNVFPSRSSSTLALTSAAKVALVHLHLTFETATFKLGYVIDRFTQSLVDASDSLVIKSKIVRKAVSRLLLIKATDGSYLCTDLLQRLLFSTALVSASHISSGCLMYLKRTTENALAALQKVGRTTKNILSSLCHMGILLPYGYETH
jgi:hypothetical protein